MTRIPSEDLIFDYATGALPEGPSLIIATHMAMNSQTQARVHAVETIGGALIADMDPTPLSDSAKAAVMAQLDLEEDAAAAARPLDSAVNWLPAPLRDYLDDPKAELKPGRYAKKLGRWPLKLQDSYYKAELMRIPAGKRMPTHTHRGEEYTLVLQGGFRDGDSHFGVGELCQRSAAHTHTPVADSDTDCLCLAVTEAPIKLTGRFGWLINPFLK